MKCFQLSCWCRLKLICTNGRHFGRFGFRMRCSPASCGVRLALSVLQSMHEQTMFSQDVGPPRSRGRTWSRFKSFRSKALNLDHVRSEEHTSELQSRSDLVCRLLLEKKKQI